MATPYLQDSTSQLALAHKLYESQKEDYEVAHILIPFTKRKMIPTDTIEIYQKAMNVWTELTRKDNPMSFQDAAKKFSSDQSNTPPGYLGWLTGNSVLSKFEHVMFSLPIGSVSKPVRTELGYHIIKVLNRRTDPGQAKVAHIMFGENQGMSPTETDSLKSLAQEVYQELVSGGDFAKLAKQYSTDSYTANKAGEVGWVTIGDRFPGEWLETCFKLQNVGDISKPVKTAFGWHIIKLLEKKERDPFDLEKAKLLRSVSNLDRKYELDDMEIQRLSPDLKPQTNSKSYAALNTLAQTGFPGDSAFMTAAVQIKLPLLSIADQSKYNTSDFVVYLRNVKPQKNYVSTEYLKNMYQEFELNALRNVLKTNLAVKYPEYKNLSNEYYDGILLFDVMNKEVWDKAQNDTIGLKDYFSINRSSYKWDAPKYKGYIIHCKDEKSKEELKKL